MALTDSVSSLIATCLDMTRSRLELLGMDLQDAAWRIAVIIAVSIGAVLLIVISSLFAASAFVLNYWTDHPLWALLAVATTYLLIGLGMLILGFRWFTRAPLFMSDSVANLRQDQSLLQGRP